MKILHEYKTTQIEIVNSMKICLKNNKSFEMSTQENKPKGFASENNNFYEENLVQIMAEIKTIKRKIQNFLLSIKEDENKQNIHKYGLMINETRSHIEYFYNSALNTLNKFHLKTQKTNTEISNDEEKNSVFIESKKEDQDHIIFRTENNKNEKTLKIYQCNGEDTLDEFSSKKPKSKMKNDSNLMLELLSFLDKKPKKLEEEIIEFSEKKKDKEIFKKEELKIMPRKINIDLNEFKSRNKLIMNNFCLQETDEK